MPAPEHVVVEKRRGNPSAKPFSDADQHSPFQALWYRHFHRLINWLYFEKITVVHKEHIPTSGAVLFLGLHRNGAVDGFVYHCRLGYPNFLISRQLTRSFFARLFFAGIPIVRRSDEGNKSENYKALAECSRILNNGGSLFVFPEGTSSLGPRHLPFQNGPAHLILQHLQTSGQPLSVIPVGIHYSEPTSFRGKVEVVLGRPVDCTFPENWSRLAQLKELKKRITSGLEKVGINASSSDEQSSMESIAKLAFHGNDKGYFEALKALETHSPVALQKEWAALLTLAARQKADLPKVVSQYSTLGTSSQIIQLAIKGPCVLAAMLLNCIPCLAAGWAAKRLADDRNVISLWKILAGVPCFLLWATLALTVTIAIEQFLCGFLYMAVTVIGIKWYASVRHIHASLWNALRFPVLFARLAEFRKTAKGEIFR